MRGSALQIDVAGTTLIFQFVRNDLGTLPQPFFSPTMLITHSCVTRQRSIPCAMLALARADSQIALITANECSVHSSLALVRRKQIDFFCPAKCDIALYIVAETTEQIGGQHIFGCDTTSPTRSAKQAAVPRRRQSNISPSIRLLGRVPLLCAHSI